MTVVINSVEFGRNSVEFTHKLITLTLVYGNSISTDEDKGHKGKTRKLTRRQKQ